MSTRPQDLPDFDNPPVVETVLSAQFEPLTQMQAAHFGIFWSRVKNRFPKTEERPPLEMVLETFPDTPKPSLDFHIESYERPPTPRFWFVNEDGTELLQAQRDRFIRNWRKVGSGDQYPRYETLRARFEEDFGLFQAFLAAEGLGNVKVNQCEVTYLNHIVVGEGWESYEQIDKVFTVWRQPPGAYPGPAHTVMFRTRHDIKEADGKPIGRLHIDLKPTLRTRDGRPMLVLDLTARGILGDATDFFDVGRERIVRSFAGITTPEMHKVWKRRN